MRTNVRKRHRFRKILIFLLILVVAVAVFCFKRSNSTTGIPVLRVDDSCVVCVDPGHGGEDQGCDWEGRLEKDDNLNVGLALRDALEQRGFTVVMTRTEDIYISLEDRVAYAEKENADYFVSLHRNYYDGDACGVEIWVSEGCSDQSERLASLIDSNLEKVGIQDNRGVRYGSENGNGSYYVLRSTTMPAVLVELGFLQDSQDNYLLDAHLEDYAGAIADAVLSVCES